MIIPTAAVIPTRDRADDPDMLARCVAAIAPQVEQVVIVDNNDERMGFTGPNVTSLHNPLQPPNLSLLYNAGMDKADQIALTRGWHIYNVALLNDDVIVPPGWVESVGGQLREAGMPAVAAYVDRLGRPDRILMTETGGVPFEQSMTCWACLIRGEEQIRWDEELHWWYADNMLDLICRRRGGVLAVPGRIPAHLHPNEQTYRSPVLSDLAGRDAATWDRKAKAMGI